MYDLLLLVQLLLTIFEVFLGVNIFRRPPKSGGRPAPWVALKLDSDTISA